MTGALGTWEPFPVATVAALMRETGARWWLSGGCALDRFVGRTTRPHGDIDVSIRRDELTLVGRALAVRLELQIARDGRLHPLHLDAAEADESVHGLWGRELGGGPWRVQINLEPCAGDGWIFRRDPRVRRPLDEVIIDLDGIPCVNPAVQLLWKAKDPGPKDEDDLANVLPMLSVPERAWLRAVIALAHPDSPWPERVAPVP